MAHDIDVFPIKCPFCYGHAKVTPAQGDRFQMVCDCGVAGPVRRMASEAIEVWNLLHCGGLEKGDVDYEPLKPPFRYDDNGEMIVNSDNNLILEVRGWGLLIGRGTGGQGMNPSDAGALQDKLGKRVARLMNLDRWIALNFGIEED